MPASEDCVTDSESSDPRGLLRLLEARRLALDSHMSQIPALIVAAQAFLLQVITRADLAAATRWSAAFAGVVASLVTGRVLAQQRAREIETSERVSAMTTTLGIGDPRRPGWSEDWAVHDPRTWRAWALWELVLLAFIVADIVAAAA